MNAVIRSLTLCAVLCALPVWSATEIRGIKFNDTCSLGSQTLQLNGVGVRVKVIIDVYAAGLYLPKKESDAVAAINEPGPKSVQMVMLRNVSGEDFADAMAKGFNKANTEADQARFQPKIDEIKDLMVAFGSVKKGAVIRVDFVPGKGTHVLIDGQQKGPVVQGDDFFNALLRIWLGEHAADSELKSGLLGLK